MFYKASHEYVRYMSETNVRVEWHNNIASVIVDRVDSLNALNVSTLREMEKKIDQTADEKADVLLLRGAGDEAFIAGADIGYMQDLSTSEAEEWGDLGHNVAKKLENYPMPTIAAIDGYAFGGGTELSLACDIRIASDDAMLGQTEIEIGIIPGWGGTQRLPRIVGDEMARRMIYLGERIDAETAKQRGLVSEVIPNAEFESRLFGLAEELANKPSFALQTAKQSINQAHEASLEAGLAHEKRAFASLFDTHDQKEGMTAFLEDRNPEFE